MDTPTYRGDALSSSQGECSSARAMDKKNIKARSETGLGKKGREPVL